MAKKVNWGPGKYSSQVRGGYRSFGEFFAKAEKIRKEQEEAIGYLQKAMPTMLQLLQYKLKNRTPLTVMRPLKYQTSGIPGEENEIDDGFYNVRKSTSMPKFETISKTIMPGTQLMLKSLDPHLREFIFEDGMGKEHCISYDDRNKLLTQTDIFETVKEHLEG